MGKDVITLTILVCLLLVINTTFIIIIQSSRAENTINSGASVQGKVIGGLIQGIIGQDPTSIFSRDVLKKSTFTKKTSSTNAASASSTAKSKPNSTPAPAPNVVSLKRVDNIHVKATVNGKETLLVVDSPNVFGGNAISDDKLLSMIQNFIEKTYEKTNWETLSYNKFDVFIDSNFYLNNTPRIDDFFNKFEPRFDLLENLTHWSPENRLKIYVQPDLPCVWGGANPTEGVVYLFFQSNFSYGTESDLCKRPYYLGGVVSYGNSGELGDYWIYMEGTLHEVTHTINPIPILSRSWLTEGWSEYYGYNVLTEYKNATSTYTDINQETADKYIREIADGGYNWPSYIANNYKDYYNKEIQSSAGYDITAWMFTMMKENKSMNWDNFYNIINNNLETLDKSGSLGDYYTDTHVIDLFGKASGMNFSQVQSIFRYDGPSGPGWGVRNWTDLNWYADLTPTLSFSRPNPYSGQSTGLIAIVSNNGGTDSKDVSVRFYNDSRMINEQFVNVSAHSQVTVNSNFTGQEGSYVMRVVVDEPNLKIESDKTNNQDIKTLVFSPAPKCGDANNDSKVNVGDAVYLINYVFKSGAAPACSPATLCGDANGDSKVNVGDAVYLINYVFKKGPAPCSSPQGYVTNTDNIKTESDLQNYLNEAMAFSNTA
jgi:hypothetical protein